MKDIALTPRSWRTTQTLWDIAAVFVAIAFFYLTGIHYFTGIY